MGTSTTFSSQRCNAVTRLCSRKAGAKVDRGWQLTTKDADAIEDALSKDNYLRYKLTSAPTKEKDPRQYYKQYVGVVVGGRKLIYVNGICVKPPNHLHVGRGNWRTFVMVARASGASCTTQLAGNSHTSR